MTRKFELFFILFSFTTMIYSQDKPLLTKTGDLIYCLDSTEFKISDFYYGQSKKEIIEILGQPDSTLIEEQLYEDDYYKGIRINYNAIGTVFRIVATSDKYSTPSGIHTGLSRNEVFKILGLKPNELPSIKFENQFINCKYEVFFVLVFDNSLILRQMEIAIDLP
jgi:hypothetical protein